MGERMRRSAESATVEGRISDAFRDLSRRNTKPRRIIAEKLTELARDDRSFTADDLWHAVREEREGIGRATVFRSIERLVDLAVLDRIDFEDGTHRFFVCSGGNHHHHLACNKCHRVVRLDYCLPDDVIAQIGRQEHFRIEGHALTLFGRCNACSQTVREHCDGETSGASP